VWCIRRTGARLPDRRGRGHAAGRDPAHPSAARKALDKLPVKGRAPKTGYDRDEFGPAWTDNVNVPGGHNGCDTRNDILRRDLVGETFTDGAKRCIVKAGLLHDKYSGLDIQFVRGPGTSSKVQGDHIVAESNAWQTGAQLLTKERRTEFANDPLNLQAVDGPLNQQKSDADAATWLPPNKAYRCTYVARQIAVKTKYALWVTPAEKTAMRGVLDAC
jgi:hypothetical protein